MHVKPPYSESHRRWAVPGDRQKGGWPSLPLGIINGRVAEGQIAEQSPRSHVTNVNEAKQEI